MYYAINKVFIMIVRCCYTVSTVNRFLFFSDVPPPLFFFIGKSGILLLKDLTIIALNFSLLKPFNVSKALVSAKLILLVSFVKILQNPS